MTIVVVLCGETLKNLKPKRVQTLTRQHGSDVYLLSDVHFSRVEQYRILVSIDGPIDQVYTWTVLYYCHYTCIEGHWLVVLPHVGGCVMLKITYNYQVYINRPHPIPQYGWSVGHDWVNVR